MAQPTKPQMYTIMGDGPAASEIEKAEGKRVALKFKVGGSKWLEVYIGRITETRKAGAVYYFSGWCIEYVNKSKEITRISGRYDTKSKVGRIYPRRQV